jgi:hypothetical protein
LFFNALTDLQLMAILAITSWCPLGGMVDATVFKTEVLAGHAGSSPVAGTILSFPKDENMATVRETMSTIKNELERVQRELAALHIEEGILQKLLSKLSGEPATPAKSKRAVGITPLILDVMRQAGSHGATSTEVATAVSAREPSVAKTSVASILSRLRSDGALNYVGDRYYEKQFTPTAASSPFDHHLRAVV